MKKNEMIKTNKVGKIEEMLIKGHKESISYDTFFIGETLTQNCGVLLDGKYKVFVTKGGDWYVTIEEWIDNGKYIPTKNEVFYGTINYIDGKECRWSKKVVENAAKIIVNAIDEYEGKINENLNGFTCKEQYDAVYDAIYDAAIVDFTAPDDIKIRTEYDYITVNIDGLEFDIDLSDETIKNITCDYPMTMFDIRRIKSVNDSIIDIYEAGRKWIKEEVELNA
jgi:hypothetical protein